MGRFSPPQLFFCRSSPPQLIFGLSSPPQFFHFRSSLSKLGFPQFSMFNINVQWSLIIQCSMIIDHSMFNVNVQWSLIIQCSMIIDHSMFNVQCSISMFNIMINVQCSISTYPDPTRPDRRTDGRTNELQDFTWIVFWEDCAMLYIV